MILLSEAIRLGGLLGPQIRNMLWASIGPGSCALGGAYEAVGIRKLIEANGGHWSQEVVDLCIKLFPYEIFMVKIDITYTNGTSNRYKNIPAPLTEAITFLNDSAKWDRNQIADWVEIKEREWGLWDNKEVKEDLTAAASPEPLSPIPSSRQESLLEPVQS